MQENTNAGLQSNITAGYYTCRVILMQENIMHDNIDTENANMAAERILKPRGKEKN